MRLTKLPLILAASSLIAAHATPASPNAVCAAQKIIDQCITDMKFGLENCASSDWDCKCDASTALVYCYSDCLEDSGRLDAQQILEQNCVSKIYGRQYTMTGTATQSAFSSASSVSSSALAEPTGSRSGLEDNNYPSSGLERTYTPSQGAAARVKAVGGWLVFLGLGLGGLV